jgi:hypothetical protein
MGITIAPRTAEYPRQHVAAIVETKDEWSGEWQYRPELLCARVALSAAGDDLGAAELQRRYGEIKQQWEGSFGTVAPIDIADHWVRVSMVCDEGVYVVFIGQISGEPRVIYGADVAPSGVQTWTAYGPLQTLRKIHVSESYWYEAGEAERAIGWVPPMNARSETKTVSGNRSDAEGDAGSYCYGGTDTWTHRQYLDYLLAHWLDDDWRLTGQTSLLDELKTIVTWNDTQTLAEMFRKLIPIRYGLDFVVRAYSETTVDDDGEETTNEGFEIHVFSLSAKSRTAGGVTLPANPGTVKIQAAEASDVLNCNVVRTRDHRYDRIRVLGKRIIVCCSLDATKGTLIPAWSDEQEVSYKAASMEQRKTDAYRAVFQAYQVPSDWDFNEGSAAPKLDENGAVVEGESSDTQLTIRNTLRWLPLFEGFDYSTDPETDNTPEWVQPDLMPPMAFVFDELDEPDDAGNVPGRYILAETADIDVHVPQEHLGIFLKCDPNHWLADGHWDDEEDAIADNELSPAYDYDLIACTIAFESDQRLMKSYTRPSTDEAGGVSTIDIIVDDAEFWYLAAGTYVGINDDGELVESGPGRILRDDSDKLSAILAGAIARYCDERARAEIRLAGLLPWQDLLGQILTVVEEGDSDSHEIGAPITSIEWHMGIDGSPTTTVRAGFAE